MEQDFRLKADGCSNYDDFTTLLKSLVNITMPKVTFMHAFTRGADPDLNKNPIITYHVISRKPADKEIKPQVRETIITDTEHLTIYGQKFDYVIEFNVWADTNVEADEIMNNFEDIIITYKGDMMNSGIQKIFFLEQLEDDPENGKNKLLCRPLRYLVRFERITVVKGSMLNLVVVRTNDGLVFQITEQDNE